MHERTKSHLFICAVDTIQTRLERTESRPGVIERIEREAHIIDICRRELARAEDL